MIPGSSTKTGHLYHQPFFDVGLPSLRKGNDERWRLLKLHQDFVGKSVLDMGCSAGFFSFAAAVEAGAKVQGIDLDPDAISACNKQLSHRTFKVMSAARDRTPPLFQVRDPVQNLDIIPQAFDVVFLLAVIPWIERTEMNPGATLELLAQIPTAYVELMYEGDGRAAMVGVKDDEDGKRYLQRFWKHAHPIGWTVPDHNGGRRRTLWRCTNLDIMEDPVGPPTITGAQAFVWMHEQFVRKEGRKDTRYQVEREVAALRAVERQMIAPTLVEHLQEKRAIITSRLRGETLAERMKTKSENGEGWEPQEILDLEREFVRLGGILRRCEVRHNDIRPENIICGVDGRVYLVDFGWAQVAGVPDKVPETINPEYRAEDDRGSFDRIIDRIWTSR